MKRLSIFLILAACVSLAYNASGADDPELTPEFGPAPSQESPTNSLPNIPLKVTISQIRSEAILQVENLQAEMLSQMQGSPEFLSIQKRISEIKVNSEVAILQAISSDAMVRNDQATVAEADQALDRLLHPENYPAVLSPATRPIPTNH